MFDGAALGTLIIGLDGAPTASDRSRAPVRASAQWSRATTSTLRVRLAIAMRLAADRLDRTPQAAMGTSRSAA